jgi:hypothetical protein
MKIRRIILFGFYILIAFACSNEKGRLKVEYASVFNKNTNKNTGKEFKNCKNVVMDILKTSPRYIQLTKNLNEEVIKNGGISFGVSLEGSPNPSQDNTCCYSKTYDFAVYEMYKNRQLNTARFSFNPNNNQLYEYDAVQDKLIEIDFDENLLSKYGAVCK